MKLSSSNFNRRAIESYGKVHCDMDNEAPNRSFDMHVASITNYLDWDVIVKWMLSRVPYERRSSLRVLDVGAGKGRMTKRFLEIASHCVAIEPFEPFYNELKRNAQGYNLETHCCTLDEYARKASAPFDLIYVSGVTPYLNEQELKEFMSTINSLLAASGLVLIRELGAERNTVETDSEINRTPRAMAAIFQNASLRILKIRRAYPVFLINKLYDKWPNVLTKFLWENLSRQSIWPFWKFLASLNLPRGGRRCFWFYLLDRST